MFLLCKALIPELRTSSEEKGAVSGEEAKLPEKKWSAEEVDEDVEDVPILELGFFRWIVCSRWASTSSKLRPS